mmetsp:Transcript_21145/g.27447  ORF Transcript_21145/g.27447 Transcript_21145/m.27447 type:complete len:90 (+) Transcript_21145:2469-2738(+)
MTENMEQLWHSENPVMESLPQKKILIRMTWHTPKRELQSIPKSDNGFSSVALYKSSPVYNKSIDRILHHNVHRLSLMKLSTFLDASDTR